MIAFDVAQEDLASLECLPEETGGMFLTADDASTLGDALDVVVEPEVPEVVHQLEPATISAPGTITADSVFEVTWKGPDNRADFITIVPELTDGAAGEGKKTVAGERRTGPVYLPADLYCPWRRDPRDVLGYGFASEEALALKRRHWGIETLFGRLNEKVTSSKARLRGNLKSPDLVHFANT